MKTGSKKVVITGASKGLGLVIAKRFKDIGYTTILISRDQPLCEYDQWLEWDLSSPDVLTKDFLGAHLGSDIDIFIANAGILSGLSPQQYEYSNMTQVLNVNFTSHVLLSNYLIECMSEQDFGRVIFISSTAAETGHPDIMYGATKAALSSVSTSYAKLYENKNITVNCIQPGAMKTSITKDMPTQNKTFLGHHTLIAGPYLELDKVVNVVGELIGDANVITGSTITMGANSVWRVGDD